MKLIDVDSLWVKNREDVILKDINFSVGKGEVLAICGEPSSGKTLLCKSIGGILPENLEISGSVDTEGRVGYVFQTPEKQLVRKTVERDLAFGLENQGLPPSKIRKRIDRYSKLFDAQDLLEKEVEKLSSGQVTKVALLGCLVTRPEIVILDEPLAGLDVQNRQVVLEEIDRLKQRGETLIIAGHDLRGLSSKIDGVILLKDGRILSRGRYGELISDLKTQGIKLSHVWKSRPRDGENL